MKHTVRLFIFLLFIFTGAIRASLVSESVIQSVARNCLTFYYNNPTAINIKQINTYTESGIPLLYIAELQPKGFLILSAWQGIKPLLAYSKNKWTSLKDTPPAFKELFHFYTNKIKKAQAEKYYNPDMVKEWQDLENLSYSKKITQSVEPLLKTSWGQTYGYSIFCPVDTSREDGHAPAGCVAVAAAQIMHYWQHPQSGFGSNSYVSENYGTLYADFEAENYRWQLMSLEQPDIYNTKILFHLGVALNIRYGPSGSFASVSYLASILKNNFNFSDSIRFWNDYFLGDSLFTKKLKEELMEERPVVLASARHAYNADGFENEYFHLNWGWAGKYNGYYYLNDLTPGWHDMNGLIKMLTGIMPAQETPQEPSLITTRISPHNLPHHSNFGTTLAACNNLLAVGAPYEDKYEGAVYIYEHKPQGWFLKYKIQAPDLNKFSGFGRMLNMSENYLYVGAQIRQIRETKGCVLIYRKLGDNWYHSQTIISEKSRFTLFYGVSSALWKQNFILGDLASFPSDSSFIQFYHFQNDSLLFYSKAYVGTGYSYKTINLSMALDKDYLLIGNPYNRVNEETTGSAFLFKFDGENWKFLNKVEAPDKLDGQSFGCSVALSDNLALVGAMEDGENGQYSGASYIYKIVNDRLIYHSKLCAADGLFSDNFGSSILLTKTKALIGAPGSNTNGPSSGCVYVYSRKNETLSFSHKLTGSISNVCGNFGQTMKLESGSLFVGAPTESADSLNAGSVYVLPEFHLNKDLPYSSKKTLDIHILPNYPNPFNQSTKFSVSLSNARSPLTKVRISVFNILGQKISTFFNGTIEGGVYQFSWDGKSTSGAALPSGIYFIQVYTKNKSASRKVILLK